MSETQDRVQDGKEYRQNIIDKTSVESSTAYTYETGDEEESCDTAVRKSKEENQKKIDERS